MTIPRFDDVRDAPLATDEEVLQRAELLLGHAIRRQLWLMFLDEDDRQLPLLMPTYVPRRRGTEALSSVDRAWLQLVRDACAHAGIPLRGPLLVHDGGIRWIAPDDLV
jgi:hypothetical protein